MSGRDQAPELIVTDDGVARSPGDRVTNHTTFGAGDATGAGAGEEPGPETRLGRFMLLRLLGQGGMGVVYTAWDELLDRRVAIKLVRTEHGGGVAQARMLHEAKGLARLSHPNVVQIYEVSASAGRLFIAMEYIPGETLRVWTADRRAAGADRRELLDMYLQAGRGLAAAHAQGLVHRDFKPDNVLVGVDGRARVVDFGLVTSGEVEAPGGDDGEVRGRPIDERITVGGMVLGTPAYMSPEQHAGRAADARSDQFSFCVALYEALCGVRPFAGETLGELMGAVSAGAPRSLPAEHALPEWLGALLRRGLAARPEDRFASMDALLDRLADDPERARRRRRRAAALVVGVAALAAMLVLLAVELRSRWLTHRRERDAELARVASEGRIAAARAAADLPAAREAFAAFVADPLHDGTAALARAWLGEARRRQEDDALAEARAGFAAAYVSAPGPELELEALEGLAGVFHRTFEWDALGQLLRVLDRRHPEAAGALARLRVDAALARRDLAGAAALLRGAGGELADLSAALGTATATGLRDVHELRVGAGQLVLLGRQGERPRLQVVRADAGLSGLQEVALPAGTSGVRLVTGEPQYVVSSQAEGSFNTLHVLADGRLTALHRWQGSSPFAGATADLDGDGARELYLGTGTDLELVTLSRQADGSHGLRTVYTPADTLESAAHGLAAADLDGDGRDELIAGFTGWRAYDVRVLRAGADGRLVAAARDKLGAVLGVATLRASDGSLRVVAKNVHETANLLVFPADRAQGEAEGLYVYTFAGERLERRYLPLPLPADLYQHQPPGIGDANGDGRDDIAIEYGQPGAVHTLLYLQTATGEFTPVMLGHMKFLGFAQLDADPAHELIVDVRDEDEVPRVWVLGAGTDVLPPVPAAAPVSAALVDPDDPAWTRQWQQAEVLYELGLLADAADAFEQLARRASGPELRARASLAAGRLRERGGQHRAAVVLLHEAGRSPGLRDEALREALTIELRLGDFEAARASLDGFPAADRDDELRRLARVVEQAGQERVVLGFDRPLDPAWRIADPLSLRRESGDEALTLATNGDGELLSLPVEWSGDLLELSVDLTVAELEYGTSLDIGLVPEGAPAGPSLAMLHVGLEGSHRGGLAVRRSFGCSVAARHFHSATYRELSLRADEAVRFEMRASAIPALGELGCDIDQPARGGSLTGRERLGGPLPAAGRYRLVIRTTTDRSAWMRAQLHRIGMRGVRLAPGDGAGAAERAIVGGDPQAALAALATATGPRERAWRAQALLQVGEVAAAGALWSELLAAPGPAPRELVQVLRGGPELHGPLLRELAGDRYLSLVHQVWQAAAVNHLGDPRPRRALQAVLASLDAASLLAATDPELLAVGCDLVRWRADIHARSGETARARGDLEAVLAAVQRLPAGAAPRRGSWMVWLELASLAAREGQLDRAREAVEAAKASSTMPLLVGDIVRARPELAAL